MDTSHPTAIAPNRSKTVLLLLLGLGLVSMGVSLLIHAPEIAERVRLIGLTSVYIVGTACVVFFGWATAFLTWRLFSRAPGLVLDAHGVTDRTSALSAGFVPWTDVVGVETGEMAGQRFLYVLLRDPDAYLRSVPPVRRALMKQNAVLGPSPVALTSVALDTGFDEMAALVRAYHAAHGPRPA